MGVLRILRRVSLFQPNSCPYCGYQPVEESQYCPQCGTYIFPPTPYEPYEQPPYSPPKHKTQDKIVYGGAIIIIAALIIYHIGYTIIQDTEEDNTPPVVLRTEPASGATDVEPQFSLKIFFSEPVTPSYSLHSAFWQIATEDTKIRWIDDQTVEITNLMFQHFGLITIHFSGDPNIQDRAGNVFTEDYSWTFKTRPPKVDILSQTTYREPTYNLIYIYGEVKNQENFNLFLSDFKIKGYDANQNFIGISRLSSETSPVNVNPGEI
ncbi:MAG: Ig-like domain-containing protein, partial [bacterium]